MCTVLCGVVAGGAPSHVLKRNPWYPERLGNHKVKEALERELAHHVPEGTSVAVLGVPRVVAVREDKPAQEKEESREESPVRGGLSREICDCEDLGVVLNEVEVGPLNAVEGYLVLVAFQRRHARGRLG